MNSKKIILFHNDTKVVAARVVVNGVEHDTFDLRNDKHNSDNLTIVTSKGTISNNRNSCTMVINDVNPTSSEIEAEILNEQEEIYNYLYLKSETFKKYQFEL